MNKSIDQSDMAEVSPVPHHSKSSSSVNSDKNSEREKAMVLGYVLGVDFGRAKIGLAIADSETKMAFAYDTIKNDGEFLQRLKDIIEKENIKTIVLGMTLHTNDKQSEQEKVDFAKMIEKEFKIQVMFQEEMFTTKMAHQNIKMRGGKDIAKTDDQEAARIILQSWLDIN
ncbi:MAG TPA: Holliday junction resolvase RuvX [Candidatus Moranbacteria bacterium]|nr:Holliday junction resolvase RuvX [Candidatus Moranbacteria bacterium]HBT46121.1 Holliday junction resolvase RuvX [Candidatus Moranbacteria bacterium]